VAALVALAQRPHPVRPLLARRELRELAGFGAGTSLVRLANFAAGHFDNLVVGRWLGPAALGIYGRAFNVVNLPLAYLGDSAWYVLYPALAELRDQPERVRRAYLAAVRVSTLTAAPVLAGMAVAAPHLVPALYGPGWGGAVLPLQLLCLGAFFRSLYRVSGALAHASGRVWGEAARQAVFAVLVVAGAVAGSRWGVGGVAAGSAAAGFAMYGMMSALSLRVLGCGWRPFVAAQLPGLGVGVLVGAAALAARLGMERGGFGHGASFAAILAVCAAVAPAAIPFLPPGVLPDRLARRVRLPAALRGAAVRLAARFA
jgi:PST family polysaccharide transporter